MNWSQLRTIFWLRWRLTRNQWSKRGGALTAIVTTLAVLGAVVIALGAGVGGTLLGGAALSQASPRTLLLVWDAVIFSFLVLWLVGVVAEIQRSETIDLGRLLHLPVSLNWIFAVNYLASHFTLSLVVFLPGALGLCAGLLWAKGWLMILLVPLVLGFVFMVTAWTYCLRGWLVALMVNPRRRRTVIMTVTISAILLGQLPNLYFNVFRRHDRNRQSQSQATPAVDPAPVDARPIDRKKLPDSFMAAHTYVPPLWVGNGAMALARGNVWPAIWASLAALVIGGAGLARAYRSTVRFYRGQEKAGRVANDARAVAPDQTGRPAVVAALEAGSAKAVRARGLSLLERRLPVVPEEAMALALAFFRSLTRAPEIKMSLVGNMVGILVLPMIFFSRGGRAPSDLAIPFIGTGAIAFSLLGLLQLMFNQFGFDRDGFRALVLLPVQRKHILLAKNLSLAPLVFVIGSIFLAVLTAVAHLPLLAGLASALQLIAAFLLLGMVGNFLSIVAPYRITAGSLKPTKASGKTTLMILFSHLLFPVAMVPVFIPPLLGLLSGTFGWLPGVVANLLASLALMALAAFFYWLSLRSLGDLLQRREKGVLLIVSQEVE
jgi:hypothetical protein